MGQCDDILVDLTPVAYNVAITTSPCFDVEVVQAGVTMSATTLAGQGPPGPEGDKGDQGDPGAQGSQGPPGLQGLTGIAATIAVGSTVTGAPGSAATVTNSGSSSAAVFNFSVPAGVQGTQGGPGPTGNAATVAVGTTTTGSPGTNAAVNNSGSSSAAVFNFTIPAGVQGQQGIQGPPGPSGSGAGDMLKSVYDTNGDNIVDHAALADTAPWTGVTGKPVTFPPDATAMLKSVYDTNGNNIVDSAEAVPWTGVTGKPATFPPDATAELVAHKGAASGYPSLDATTHVPIAQLPAPASGDASSTQLVIGNDSRLTNARTPTAHASTHKSGGSDVIALDTLASPTDIVTLNSSTTAHGLLPKLSGNTGTFLRGDGTFTTIPVSGDMLKSVYDTNADNIVDHAALADAAPWSGITAKPSIPFVGVVTKTAAYTVLTTDAAKLFICSGGAFALTFPSAVTAGNGWSIMVRNVYANSTAQGTVSLTSVSSQTFNGLASPFPLLPGQECTVISDGTNWQVFGLPHEVLLATVDIVSATASQTLALPAYRYFDIDIFGAACSASDATLELTGSANNGSTFGTSYIRGDIYDSTATTMAFIWGATDPVIYLSPGISTDASRSAVTDLKFWPGSATRFPSYRRTCGAYGAGTGRVSTNIASGYMNITGPVNYLKVLPSTGTINEMHLTLIGVA